MRFGYAGAFDHASERLGIKGSTAQKMVRFAERLRGRPLLRAAVWLGDITVSQAETSCRSRTATRKRNGSPAPLE